MSASQPDTSRDYQRFPVLTAAQIAVARRFASGAARRFTPGEIVYDVGEHHAPTWLVLAGSIESVRRDGRGEESPITTHLVGQFTGEVSQLAGRPALAAGRAGPEGAEAVPFDAAHLRALVIGSAELGELVMRAFILRRVGLIQSGGVGSVVIGRPGAAEVVRLQEFLSRNGYPVTVLDAEHTDEGRELVERFGVHAEDLPLMLCPNGAVLKHPTAAQAAACLGIMPELEPGRVYDVAVVGAGPAGLAAAVYAASEGLSVLVMDERVIGGQAGASSRIENYLGFPTGISGQALAGRAFNQALKFGAEVGLPLEVTRLVCEQPGGPLRLELREGGPVLARTVVIASGAQYRRLGVANLPEFEGAGVSYWATPIEAKLCAGEEIALVGGGNSAGQAVAFLAPHVRRLHLVVRREGLEATMSKYLIDRIGAFDNVQLHPHTEVTELEGDGDGLASVVFRNDTSGAEQRRALRHLFLFIGADPNSDWLKDCVALDNKGFVLTGSEPRLGLQTSLPGVFAIGDVRAGSTKRVAAGVGEGAAVVAQIHQYLAQVLRRE